MIELTVDGAIPGAELRREKGDRLSIRARVRCHASIGVLERVEVVSNSQVIAFANGDGEKTELIAETKLAVEASRWITAYAHCKNGAIAHTSPVYVSVDGKPTWNPRRGPEIVERQLTSIDGIEREFAARSDARSRGIRQRLAAARKLYHRLRKEMRAD